VSKSERATKYFFWTAFGAFLAMSVPHVAWVFRFYEPKNDGYDLAWWVISYGVAISIDLLICWLSYTRSDQEQKKGDSAITWTFIFLLALLSWYCNWLFSEVMSRVDVWSLSLPFRWTIGTLTPVMVSAIPMFVIAYTYMSRRILGAKSAVKSAAELEQDLAELKKKSHLELQIAALKNKQKSSWIRGKFQMVSDAFSGQNQAQIEDDSEQDLTQISPEIKDEITVISGSNLPQNHVKILPKLGAIPPPISDAPLPLQAGRLSQYLMTFEEASAYTGYAISTLKKQLNTGEISANKTGDKLKVSTLRIRTGMTGKMPAVTVEKVPASNGRY
jgi:hypothetical protein